MALDSFLKPLGKYKLERFGNNNDGGYLIGPNSIHKSKTLISFGIFDDWSFEETINKKLSVNTL